MPLPSVPPEQSDAQSTRLARLQAFLDQDPDNLPLLTDVADLALACGDFLAARNALRHGLELRPGDPCFCLRLSSVALAEGSADEALGITEQLLALGQYDPAIRFNRAFALVRLGRFAEAKELLVALHGEETSYPLVVRLLIRCHHYLGELEEAVALAKQYLAAHPDEGDVSGMLSLLYFDSNDLAQAGEWARRALACAPDNPDALLAAGGAALGAEKSRDAREFLLRAVDVDPRNGRAWLNLGLADLLEFNLEAARSKLDQAARYMPGHIGTWHVLAWIHLLLGDIDAAEASFKRALEIDENFGETHGGLAAVAAMRGEWEAAEKLSKTARRLDPGSMSAHYGQIVRLRREGRADAAMHVLESALRQGKAPAGGSLLEMLGRVASRHRR